MELAQHKALLIALALAALAGCRTNDMSDSTAGTTESVYGTPGQQMEPSRQDRVATPTPEPQPAMAATQPNAVVMNIETVSRSSAMAGAGATTSGTSGAMGRTGTESDRIYRITVRMDDGTSRMLMQERAPSFRPGDRVTVSNDMITEQ